MPYKPTGNPPGRPRYLPPFNSEIPTYLVREYPSLLDKVEEAVRMTELKAPNCELLWLNVARIFRNRILNTGRILSGRNTVSLSVQQLSTLEWLQKKGKHDWQKQLRDAGEAFPSSTTGKAKGSKGGPSTGRKTRMQPIHVTTPGHSKASTSTESK